MPSMAYGKSKSDIEIQLINKWNREISGGWTLLNAALLLQCSLY